jgi:hypothetical protein
MKYPKTIYVQNDTFDGEDDFLAWKDVKDTKDGEVAVYVLEKMVKKTTETSIEIITPKN